MINRSTREKIILLYCYEHNPDRDPQSAVAKYYNNIILLVEKRTAFKRSVKAASHETILITNR